MENTANNVASISTNKSGDPQQADQSLHPYNDLRELLNKKRQSKNDPKTKPPAEPRYNFLSDPLRDNNDHSKFNNYDGSNYPQRNSNQYRGRSRGRGWGRGRVYYRGNNYNRNYGREDDQKYEATDDNASDKFENHSDNDGTKSKIHVQNSTFSRSNTEKKYKNPTAKQHFSNNDNEKQFEQTARKNETSSSNYEPRKNYRGGNSYQYQQPQRYQNYRGRPYVKRAPRKVNPVNITVEYSVDSGARKCKMEYINVKEDKQNRPAVKEEQKCAEVNAEENWDDEDAGDVCDSKSNVEEDNKEVDEKVEPAEKN